MAGLSEVACLYVDFGGRFVADFESCAYECEGACALSQVVGGLERTVCGRLK